MPTDPERLEEIRAAAVLLGVEPHVLSVAFSKATRAFIDAEEYEHAVTCAVLALEAHRANQ